MRPAPPHGRPGESGVVIIFMVAIIAALAVMATAFIIVTREESSASSNALAAVQAEEMARAALEHAVGEIEYCEAKLSAKTWLAVTPDGVLVDSVPTWRGKDYDLLSTPHHDPDSGWHRCFTSASGGVNLLWVNHYGNEVFSKSLVAQGGRAAYPADTESAWIDFPKPLLDRVGRYAVAVVDLDGKSYTSLQDWEDQIEGTDTAAACFDALQARPDVPDSVVKFLLAARKLHSLGEVADTLGLDSLARLSDPDSWLLSLTCYPVAAPSDIPPVNINTARESVICALLSQVPSLKNPQGADKLGGLAAIVAAVVGGRPFAGREQLEDALVALTRKPGGSDEISDRQFNDTLNSLNGTEGSIYAMDGDSVARTKSEPSNGKYQMDFDKDDDGSMVPSNSGGDATKPDDNVTWCTTLKFSSRWFQIHARAQVLDPKSYSVLAWRELQAVYDSENDRVVYFRWETEAR